MAEIKLTRGRLALGEEPWAYEIHSWFPQCIWFDNFVYFRQVYDCLGRPMDGYGKFPCYWMEGGIGKSATLRGHGSPAERGFKGIDVITDIRSVGMIVNGCCPPELMLAFLGTEGMPD